MNYFSKIFLSSALSVLCLFCENAFAQSCPAYSLGAYETKDKKGIQIFISTAAAKFEDESSINLAVDTAKITAKDNLQKLNNFPKDEDRKLSGVLDITHCISGNHVFATVKYSTISNRASKSLREIMDESLRSYPIQSSR